MTVQQQSYGRKAHVLKVLVIEDNDEDYLLTEDKLLRASLGAFQLHNVARLSSAIEVLEREKFDAILLDLNLPDSQGYETFTKLHSRFPHLPLIILTGSTDEEPAIRAIDEGAQDYLFKDELTSRSLSHSILYAIERKKTEESLLKAIEEREESHRLLRAIMEYVPEGITITGGPPEFPIESVSRYTLKTTGQPAGRLIGVPAGRHYEAWGLTLLDGTTPRPDQMPLYRAAKFAEATLNFELLMRTADGRELIIIDSAAPIRDKEGRVQAAINVWREISEIKEKERELEDARSRAELYLDLLTHDINNYNASAMGYLQLAEMRLDLEDKDKRLISRPLEELRNSTLLIASVRDIQRLEVERQKAEAIYLCKLLEEIKSEYENPPGREVVITVTDHDHCSITASSLLKEAFSNIVNNAIKHSSGPLRIGIDLSLEPRAGQEFTKVSIDDNGPGITDELKAKMFNRTVRGATKAAGRGMGLYLVKRLVEDNNGTIWVEDRVPGDFSKGARFVVLLPASSTD